MKETEHRLHSYRLKTHCGLRAQKEGKRKYQQRWYNRWRRATNVFVKQKNVMIIMYVSESFPSNS